MFTLNGNSGFRADTKSYTIKNEQQRYWTGTSHSHTSNIMPERLAEKLCWTKSRQSSLWIRSSPLLNLFTSATVRIPVRAKCARGTASLCHRNRAEITVLVCEQKPYLVRFSCLRKSHPVEREQLALMVIYLWFDNDAFRNIQIILVL